MLSPVLRLSSSEGATWTGAGAGEAGAGGDETSIGVGDAAPEVDEVSVEEAVTAVGLWTTGAGFGGAGSRPSASSSG